MGRIVGGAVPRGRLTRALGLGAALSLLLLPGGPAAGAHGVIRHRTNQEGLPQLQVLAIA